MQKILILITKSNWGGAQRYVYDLATSLPKDSYDVEVMAGGNGVLIEKLVAAGVQADGNLPIGRDLKLSGDIKAFFKLISILREKKPDILHVNSSKIGVLGTLAGRLSGIPQIIFTAHGWAFNEDRGLIWKLFLKSVHWITILLSHRTIAVSEALKYQASNWPLIQGKVAVIRNGIRPEAIFSKLNARAELAKLNPKLAEILKKSDPKKTTFIGTIAELHHIKGYDYALRGIHNLITNAQEKKSLSNFIYVIIGNGEEKARIEKTIEDLGLQDNVILLGHVENASHYLKALDIFLLASLSEGLGYVLLEAGLASLPVLATAVGGIPEIIDDMKSGILVQSRKPKEIQHALEFYMTHKKTQKEYGAMFHKKVLDDFSIEKMIRETVKIYSAKNR